MKPPLKGGFKGALKVGGGGLEEGGGEGVRATFRPKHGVLDLSKMCFSAFCLFYLFFLVVVSLSFLFLLFLLFLFFR